jgi:hypothetical protein
MPWPWDCYDALEALALFLAAVLILDVLFWPEEHSDGDSQ